MNASSIIHILRNVPIFGGVLGADQTSYITDKKIYVVNTQEASRKGEHWVIIDNYTESIPFFFDSFGNSPEFYDFTNNVPVHYSTDVLQGNRRDTCGLYCIFFIVKRWQNIPIRQILGEFSRDTTSNDRFLINWTTTELVSLVT